MSNKSGIPSFHKWLWAILIVLSLLALVVVSVVYGTPGVLVAVGVSYIAKTVVGLSSLWSGVLGVLVGGTVSAITLHKIYVWVHVNWINRFGDDGISEKPADLASVPSIENYWLGLLAFYPSTAIGLLATSLANPVATWLAGSLLTEQAELAGALLTGSAIGGLLALATVAVGVWRKWIKIPSLEGRF